jgi:predicted kinase
MTSTNNHRIEEQEEGWSTVSQNQKNNKMKRRSDQRPAYTPILIEPIPQTPQNIQFQPFMILLVGLPGSGKSTLSALLENTMPYKFVRINQDQLGSRKKCESALIQTLQSSRGVCPIIDRCNFDYAQRSTWYAIAEQFHLKVDVIVLDVPEEECIRRCSNRVGHETLHTAGQAKGVIKQLMKQFRHPPEKSKELRRYRSLTFLRTDDDNDIYDCLIRLLNQME